jgi:GNAT superfamily N-acetyltransferase
MITFEWSDWRNKNIWWIQSVFVDKNYRNRKVFSKLFKSVTKMALSKKEVGGVRLSVEEHNDSTNKFINR